MKKSRYTEEQSARVWGVAAKVKYPGKLGAFYSAAASPVAVGDHSKDASRAVPSGTQIRLTA